jgi:hypothetical protein
VLRVPAAVDDDALVLLVVACGIVTPVETVVGGAAALDALRFANTPMAMATTNPMTTAKPI